MPQRRAPGFRIEPSAWDLWENVGVPMRLEDAVDALLRVEEADAGLVRLGRGFSLWQMRAVVEGMPLILVGARNPGGEWVRVDFVHPGPDTSPMLGAP